MGESIRHWGFSSQRASNGEFYFVVSREHTAEQKGGVTIDLRRHDTRVTSL